MLREEMTFNTDQITSTDRVSYPILLGFADSPILTTINVPNPTLPRLARANRFKCPSWPLSPPRSTTQQASGSPKHP